MRTAPAVAIAAAILIAAYPLAGQDTRLGVSAGFSSSTFAGDPADIAHHNSLTVGVTLTHWWAGRLAVESGLHWLQSGGSGTVVVPGGDESLIAAHELSYVTLPLLLRAAFLDVGTLQLTAVAGPNVAYRVGCDADIDPGLGYLALIPCAPRREEGRLDLLLVAPVDEPRLDVGVLLGGGASIDRGGWALTLDARYGLGMRNLRGSYEPEVRNETLMLVAGLSVPVGG